MPGKTSSQFLHASRLSRRQFLRRSGIASSALTLSPFFLERFAAVAQAAGKLARVYKVKNSDHHTMMMKLLDMLGGIGKYISATDVVVIKGNAQWPRQGYTHTGCIKEVIDAILAIPGFSGEVLICDDTQNYAVTGQTGFDATTTYRVNNWPDQNWNSLAAAYQALGKPVGAKRWQNMSGLVAPPTMPYYTLWNPGNGEGWSRYFFNYGGRPSYLSWPVFRSPVTSGRMIDMKYGVWENGSYTGRRVKTIVMPTLNNHAWVNQGGNEDECGVTSAIKSFFGATEIHAPGNCSTYNGFYHIHSYCPDSFGQAIGELVGTYITNVYSPVLYITPAIYVGWKNRWVADGAVAANTVLACENPVTLDYISCRDVISSPVYAPYYAPWLNPDNDNNTRHQILGCNSFGIGTIDPQKFEVMTYDFNNPTTTRLDVERKIRDFKSGNGTQQDVKDAVNAYMQGN